MGLGTVLEMTPGTRRVLSSCLCLTIERSICVQNDTPKLPSLGRFFLSPTSRHTFNCVRSSCARSSGESFRLYRPAAYESVCFAVKEGRFISCVFVRDGRAKERVAPGVFEAKLKDIKKAFGERA